MRSPPSSQASASTARYAPIDNSEEGGEMTETIAPPTAKPIHHWIGGKSVPGTSGRSGPVWNPATGEQSGAVDFATPEEIDAAVQTAKQAFTSWRHVSLARRAELFFTIRALFH